MQAGDRDDDDEKPGRSSFVPLQALSVLSGQNL
jgi:hypothetical protein